MFKRLRTLAALTILYLSVVPISLAEDEGTAKSADSLEPIGYFLGLSVGQQMRKDGFQPGDFEVDSLIAGFNDGLNTRDAALTDDQLRDAQKNIQALLQKRQAARRKVQMEKNEKFLAENAKKDGVKVLEGGVQYKVLKAGQGASPTPTDTVTVHYTGQLVNGKVFDSSVKRGEPATFRVNGVIRGWQMALQNMKVGDKWMLYIPSDLAYGEKGSQGAIGPNEVLIFEVELLAIQ
jgi:FKBP-type peptidyl-prolyl cis-trans isomerase